MVWRLWGRKQSQTDEPGLNWWRVLVHGEGFRLPIEGQLREMGLYTTRAVQARSVAEATEKAIGLARAELAEIVEPDDRLHLRLQAETCEQVTARVGRSIPQTGFAFYCAKGPPQQG